MTEKYRNINCFLSGSLACKKQCTYFFFKSRSHTNVITAALQISMEHRKMQNEACIAKEHKKANGYQILLHTIIICRVSSLVNAVCN